MAVDPNNPYLDPVTGLPKAGAASNWLNTQPTVDDSMANQVNTLTAKDNPYMQAARTEGLKSANARGLLNSSMAIGAAQDAAIRNVLPIAQQDAATAAAKNAAARGFEYAMTGQEGQNRFASGERQAAQGFQTGEREAGQQFLTGERLGTQEFQTGERLGTQAFTTGERLGTQEFQSTEAVAARGWQTAENLAQRNFVGDQAGLDRAAQAALAANQITSNEYMQFRALQEQGREADAQDLLQRNLQENDIAFRMQEGNLTREAAIQAQQNDIAFNREQGALNRNLQLQIANMNLSATQKASAAQLLTNMETMYQTQYQSIMGNTSLTAAQRTQLLTAAKNQRNTELSFVNQIYKMNPPLKWS